MTDDDRKALESVLKNSGLPTRRSSTHPTMYADHDARLVRHGWLAAHKHYRQQVEELVEALDNMATQYGCECGHPACKRCQDTREAKLAIGKLKERQ